MAEPAPKKSKQEMPVHVADIPGDQLKFLTEGHGCADIRHGGYGESDLLTHLTEVRWVLKDKLGCTDDELLAASLFHSIYGTEGFQQKTVPLADRPRLRSLIGERAEFVAYLNCVMDRASLDAAVIELADWNKQRKAADPPATAAAGGDGDGPPGFAIQSRPELGAEKITVTAKQLTDLMLVHFSDWAQQVALYSYWAYRRQAYLNIATSLGGKCAELYREIMATEPEGAEEKLPEMVRARKLGVFDKIMSKEIDYMALLDDKIASNGEVAN
mmetsp:Transcript_76374/g.236505  ORF Transcript_76374/g.236505 Transcript_76374/m.236505 type:complete len:272 (+) Transcript_76374:77-892(+)